MQINFHKSKTKKQIFIIAIITFIILLFLALLVVRAFFRPICYQIRISDSLYDTYVIKENISEKLPFKLVRESDYNSTKEKFFGAIPVTAAVIYQNTQIPLLSQNKSADTTYYPLSKSYILPIIPADFEKETQSASLSISFSDSNTFVTGMRALPIDGVYASQDNYQLTCVKNAVCTVFVQKIKPKIEAWCVKTFLPSIDNISEKNELTFISSVGDIMVARGTEDILINDEDGLEKIFTDTLPLLQNSNITIGNLEGVVTNLSKNIKKTYTFKFKEEVLPFLKEAGFNYFMQTNNHCYDYGEAGFIDTLAALKKYGIATSGVGKNIEEAQQFYYTTVGKQDFAILSCGAYPVENSGFNGETMAQATEDRAGILWKNDDIFASIKKEKQAGKVVIINVHGGQEYHFNPNKEQKIFYRQLCDAGADVVLGSHPHVLQKPEWYKKSLIVYSQGNFLFNGMDKIKGATDSEIVRLGILDGKIVYCEIYPATLKANSVFLK